MKPQQLSTPRIAGVSAMRPFVRGKFIYVGDEKYWVRGATYGAFPPHPRGDWFPEEAVMARDFALMREAGINTILTYTLPSARVLDLAHEHDLRAILNIPWFDCDYYLESAATRRALRQMVRDAIAPLREHPALMMWCVGKELPPDVVRWYGKRLIETLIHSLYDIAKEEDPGALASFTSFPTTEYLDLSFVDVCTFNVYLHTRPEFGAYLARLQHVAGELPLVITEFGMCSLRHGRETQADFLNWQIEEIFDRGCAGGVVFSWLDPFYGDKVLVEDWHFGLVDANRTLKPSYGVVQKRFKNAVPFVADRSRPKISVVVAAYNAAATLAECLSSLQALNYPNYEVIVVDDGSTDGTDAIAAHYRFRVITTSNSGVGAARNEGLRAATGDIVAYIDSDAYADPDWLSYIATTLTNSDFVATGGPNLLPAQDNDVAQCVYRAPGGPTHVMVDDEEAEHIPGCNMAFWKKPLEAIGGFDSIFTKAGDDVDVCWRLLAEGGRIGFSPSATVWHHRRLSICAFWRQQVGYGVSEALLERKHANKFNRWGHALWCGRIYSPYPVFRLFSRPVVYHGLWGSAPFQPMYDAGAHHILEMAPRAPEWYGVLALLFAASVFYPWFLIPAFSGAAYTFAYAIVSAGRARLDDRGERKGVFWSVRMRAIIAWLHIVEPAARSWGRLKGGLTPWRQIAALPRAAGEAQHAPCGGEVQWTHDLDGALDKAAILGRMTPRLNALHCAVHWNMQTDDWDMQVRRGASAMLTLHVLVEHRGGSAWRARFRATLCRSMLVDWLAGLALLGAPVALYFSAPIVAGAALLFFATISMMSYGAKRRLANTVRVVIDDVMSELKRSASPAGRA